ncbi:MAG: aminotransferase class III-fold pyridoxal phosphate-dependent enzyme, partial [Gammaproteobacteria bacterium]
LQNLREIQGEYPSFVSNVRGLGLMCSFDMPNAEIRNKFREECYKQKLLILGCGERSIRFRPPLNVQKEDLAEGLKIIKKVLFLLSSNN